MPTLARNVVTLYIIIGVVAGENAYLPYCAKLPLRPDTRQSPPLSTVDQARDLTLIQAQLFVRHGARTPASFEPCWEGYHPHWDCQYDEAVRGMGIRANMGGASTLSFRKVFDANPTENVFPGTCQKGQLLSEGALQHQYLGRLLAESYLLSEHPKKLPRPHTPPLVHLNDSAGIYFRSTDMQRTRLSGSNVLSAFLREGFGTLQSRAAEQRLTLHTVDLDNEYLFDNHKRCPKLIDAAHNVFESSQFHDVQLHSSNPVIHEVETALQQTLPPGLWPDGLLDCTLVYLCSDRWTDLPVPLRPNGTSSASAPSPLVQRVMRAVEKETALLYLFNDSAFSKLATARLFVELRDRLVAATTSASSSSVSQFYLSAVHDTSLMGILGALGPAVWSGWWPPYASILAFELFHEEATSSHLLRIVANGQVVTDGIPNCEGMQLCDLKSFMRATTWASQKLEECDISRIEMRAIPAWDVWDVWPQPSQETNGEVPWCKPFGSFLTAPSLIALAAGLAAGYATAWKVLGRTPAGTGSSARDALLGAL